jgi:hypothetical protein
MIQLKFENIEDSNEDLIANVISPYFTLEEFRDNKVISKGGQNLIDKLMEYQDDLNGVIEYDECILSEGFETNFKYIIHLPFDFILPEEELDINDLYGLFLVYRDIWDMIFITALSVDVDNVGFPVLYNDKMDLDTVLYMIYSTASQFKNHYENITFYTLDINIAKRWTELFNN